jgi:hypothetical protein
VGGAPVVIAKEWFTVEEAALDWFQSFGFSVAFRPDMSHEVKFSKLISWKLRVSDAEKYLEEA